MINLGLDIALQLHCFFQYNIAYILQILTKMLSFIHDFSLFIVLYQCIVPEDGRV